MSSEIDELINGYLDESLTEREQRELSDWIKADPTNAKHFAKAVMLHDRLQGEISAAAANAEFAADSKVVEFPKLGAHFSKRMIQLAAAIALMLTVLYWPTGPGTKVVEIPRGVEAPHVEKGFATIAHVIDVEFGEGSELKAGQRLGEHTIFMNSGVLRLQFDSGVEVTVQGPAKYELRGPAFTKLSSGLLTANVPPGAEGFRVDTPTAEVTDLGTSFGIRLDPDGASHVSVFEGEVEVEEPDSGEKKLLKEGEEIFVTAEHKLESAKFDAKPYENIWPVSSGIVGSTGAFRLAPPWPKRLVFISSDEHVFLFPDGYRRRLRHPLSVNISVPGKVVTEAQLSPMVIPPGHPVRSFIIQHQPVANLPRPQVKRMQGSITFDRPILGLIVLQDELRDSSGRFSKRKVGAQPRNQLELTGIPAGDRLTLSEDRRTLAIDLASPNRSTDILRVIVDATPPRRLARR
jgi:hypothetical protein